MTVRVSLRGGVHRHRSFTAPSRSAAPGLARRVLAVTAAAVLLVGLLPAGTAQAAVAASSATTSAVVAPVERLAGASRYDTAVEVSGAYEPGVNAVFVATGADFPDALSAAAAAAHLGGPLLLTMRNRLPEVVADEIRRLDPEQIYAVGGAGVISVDVIADLEQIAPTDRLSGKGRYETGLEVVRTAFGSSPVSDVFLATGRDFADALAASGAAARLGAPVILVDGSRTALPQTTLDTLARLDPDTVSLAGGYGAVSAQIHRQLSDAGFTVNRYGGLSRYDTAVLVNEAFFDASSTDSLVLATGRDFPDALAGAAYAGHINAPLFITMPSCLPPSSHIAATSLDVERVVVTGGASVVSEIAATLTPCATPDMSTITESWEVGGWSFDDDVAPPYSDRDLVDLAATRTDDSGLVEYLRRDNRERADHPVAYAQYGITALGEYERTGNAAWLRSAVRQAEQLASMRTIRGDAWWFPYGFPWYYGDRALQPPWWSGMAQGEALSLFARLAQTTGEQRWQKAAHATWRSFTQPRSTTAPWSTMILDGGLLFEEYAGNEKPLVVLNGHIFAIFGLYDYWRWTGDDTVRSYLDGGAQQVLTMMPSIRKGGDVSYYCADRPFCATPRWQNQKYHVIHSWQLDTLARLTGDDRFAQWAQLLRDDWAPPALRGGQAPPTAPDPLDAPFAEEPPA